MHSNMQCKVHSKCSAQWNEQEQEQLPTLYRQTTVTNARALRGNPMSEQLPQHLRDLFDKWRRSRTPQETRDAWQAYLTAWLAHDEQEPR
jgi:hypothetical protein